MSSKYRIEELNEPPPRLPGIRSLLPLPGGDLLTGGTDLKIRRWDYSRFLNLKPSTCVLYILSHLLWINKQKPDANSCFLCV